MLETAMPADCGMEKFFSCPGIIWEKRAVRHDSEPALIQYLGTDVEEFELKLHIAKEKIRKGDSCLLCSDGLRDMLAENKGRPLFMRFCIRRYGSRQMLHD